MDFMRLGSSELKVSRLCLGMMTYGSRQWREWILDEAVAALGIQLKPEELQALAEPYEAHPVLGHS